jgi:hypothetical protein
MRDPKCSKIVFVDGEPESGPVGEPGIQVTIESRLNRLVLELEPPPTLRQGLAGSAATASRIPPVELPRSTLVGLGQRRAAGTVSFIMLLST